MLLLLLCMGLFAGPVHAAIPYTSLVDSTILDGPKADIQTVGSSYLTIVVVIAGLGLIVGALHK